MSKNKKVVIPTKKELLKENAERFQRAINGFYKMQFLRYGDRQALLCAINIERLAVKHGFTIEGEVRSKHYLRSIYVKVPNLKSKQKVKNSIEERFSLLLEKTKDMDIIPLEMIEKYEEGNTDIFEEKLFNETCFCYDKIRGLFGCIVDMFYDEIQGCDVLVGSYVTLKDNIYITREFEVNNLKNRCVVFNNFDHVKMYANKLEKDEREKLLKILKLWKLNASKINY